MIWITGSKGMLGSELCRLFTENKIEFTGTGREVSVTDYDALETFSRNKPPAFIINCASYTKVDRAEKDIETARAVNSTGAGNIARLAGKLGVPMIHISSDYVFGGTDGNERQNIPYTETSPLSPAGAYGLTKAEGEKAVASETDAFYILRTAWLYGFYGDNFVCKMLSAMNSKESVNVVCDQKGTPTNCSTLSKVILNIIQNHTKIPYGIYNVTDLGEATWFDFAGEIQKFALKAGILKNESCIIKPCKSSEYPSPVKRPSYSVLDKSKIMKIPGIILPQWQESLESFISSPLINAVSLNLKK